LLTLATTLCEASDITRTSRYNRVGAFLRHDEEEEQRAQIVNEIQRVFTLEDRMVRGLCMTLGFRDDFLA
jgi:hypothetical protein